MCTAFTLWSGVICSQSKYSPVAAGGSSSALCKSRPACKLEPHVSGFSGFSAARGTWEHGHRDPLPLPVHHTWTDERAILPRHSNTYDSVSCPRSPIAVKTISSVNLQAGRCGRAGSPRPTRRPCFQPSALGPPASPCTTSTQRPRSWHAGLGTREPLLSRPLPRTVAVLLPHFLQVPPRASDLSQNPPSCRASPTTPPCTPSGGGGSDHRLGPQRHPTASCVRPARRHPARRQRAASSDPQAPAGKLGETQEGTEVTRMEPGCMAGAALQRVLLKCGRRPRQAAKENPGLMKPVLRVQSCCPCTRTENVTSAD